MATSNHKGQILIEVCVVMLVFAFVALSATFELTKQEQNYSKFQFTQENKNAKKTNRFFKK